MPITENKFFLGMIWLAVATGSVVFIEPAPTDLLTLASLALFFLLGLRVPHGVGLPALLLGIFLACNVIAAAFATEPLATIRFMSVRFYMAASCLLFTCLIYQNAKRVLPVLWSGYIFAALIAVVFGVVAFYGVMDVGYEMMENDRVRAFFKDPNVYGPFLVPVALYSIARLEVATKGQVALYLAILIACAIAILLAFSRGAYINFVTSFIIYLVVRLTTQRNQVLRSRMLRLTAVMLLGGIVAVGGLATTDKVQNMLKVRMKVVQYYDMGEGGRLTRQLEIVKGIAVQPIGIGPGESEKDYYFGQAPHNLYLHTMIESGWIGGIAFLSFLFATIFRSARYIRRSVNIDGTYIAVLAALLGILAQSLFIDSTHWRHMYLLIAMLWGPLLYWENHVLHRARPARRPIMQPQIRAT